MEMNGPEIQDPRKNDSSNENRRYKTNRSFTSLIFFYYTEWLCCSILRKWFRAQNAILYGVSHLYVVFRCYMRVVLKLLRRLKALSERLHSISLDGTWPRHFIYKYRCWDARALVRSYKSSMSIAYGGKRVKGATAHRSFPMFLSSLSPTLYQSSDELSIWLSFSSIEICIYMFICVYIMY